MPTVFAFLTLKSSTVPNDRWHICPVWSVLVSYSIVVLKHYNDVIMGAIASQITSLTMVYSIVYSDADQRKHQSSPSLAFVRWIHRGPVNAAHKWPVTRKMFPFDDVIMKTFFYVHLSVYKSLHLLTVPILLVFLVLNKYIYELSSGMTWNSFLHCWPSVRGISRSRDSPYKASVMRNKMP